MDPDVGGSGVPAADEHRSETGSVVNQLFYQSLKLSNDVHDAFVRQPVENKWTITLHADQKGAFQFLEVMGNQRL